VGAKQEIYAKSIDSRKWLAIILVSSNFGSSASLSDRVIVLHEGRITGEFTRAEATDRDVVRHRTHPAGGVNQNPMTRNFNRARQITDLGARLRLALIVIWLFFQWATIDQDHHLRPVSGRHKFSKLLQQTAVTGVLAVGMLMIVSGNIDLSISAVVGLAGASPR
jgi:ABC-type glutathione transport system ATPase component